MLATVRIHVQVRNILGGETRKQRNVAGALSEQTDVSGHAFALRFDAYWRDVIN